MTKETKDLLEKANEALDVAYKNVRIAISDLRDDKGMRIRLQPILNEIQRNFPVRHRPFLALARKLKLKEKEILQRVQRLKAAGIIRRIGASLSASAVGFTSTLCAAKVPQGKIGEFVAVVNTYPGVTHNYEREGDFNIWFTLIAPGEEELAKLRAELAEATKQANGQPVKMVAAPTDPKKGKLFNTGK